MQTAEEEEARGTGAGTARLPQPSLRTAAGVGRPTLPGDAEAPPPGLPAPPIPEDTWLEEGLQTRFFFPLGVGVLSRAGVPLLFRTPEAEGQRGRGHVCWACLPGFGFRRPHRWHSAAVPSVTGVQSSQDRKGRLRGCRNPGKAQLAWEAYRGSPWGLGAGQGIPCSGALSNLCPQSHPTLARESWLPTPHCSLCSSGGLGWPAPGQFLKRLVVGLVGSPAQVTGAHSRRRSDQQPGPPSGEHSHFQENCKTFERQMVSSS